MPKLTVSDVGSFEVSEGKNLRVGVISSFSYIGQGLSPECIS